MILDGEFDHNKPSPSIFPMHGHRMGGRREANIWLNHTCRQAEQPAYFKLIDDEIAAEAITYFTHAPAADGHTATVTQLAIPTLSRPVHPLYLIEGDPM